LDTLTDNADSGTKTKEGVARKTWPGTPGPWLLRGALGTKKSGTEGGLGLHPKLQKSVFTLTLESDEERGRGLKKPPVTTAGLAHLLPQRSFLPPHLSQARGLRGPVVFLGSRSKSCRDVGCLRRPANDAVGSGASAGMSAAAGSRGLPPHAGGARAADTARSPWADESGEGAGGRERAPLLPRRGLAGGPEPRGARLRVPAGGCGVAGRRHGARGDGALLPSEGTGRGERGWGEGITAQASAAPAKKDKRDQGS
jgi:hypothetical protein